MRSWPVGNDTGRNALPRAKRPGRLLVFLRQFRSPLIYVLLVAAVASFVMSELSDAGFILLVLAINATIGTVQEWRAQQSAEALQAMINVRARVVHDGNEHEINAEELVPGDVVVIESGGKVPADLRLITSAGVEIDESLPGESMAAAKQANLELASSAAVADRRNMAFAGTIVTHGRGYGLVVATGLASQIGNIASAVLSAETAKPPLLIRMERFTKKIAVAVALAVVPPGGLALARGASLHEVFLVSVALAVSVIPEGLPVALTVALAIAMKRMSRRKVVARRLVAVEALGSCTFIASDKTGTLTMNQLTARRLLLPGEEPWDVPHEGAAPRDLPRAEKLDLEHYGEWPSAPRLVRIGQAVTLCNDATLTEQNGEWKSHGDAVDVALLVLAQQLGIARSPLETAEPRIAELPFEAEHRFAATLNSAGGAGRLVVKGAPERVLAMCRRMAGRAGDVALEQTAMEQHATALATAGYRVLAVAEGQLGISEVESARQSGLAPGTLNDLVLLGFVGMIDPLRPEAPAAIKACQQAGIEVAMVTGDHPVTAFAIASELGLAHDPGQVVTGAELQAADARGGKVLDQLVARGRVFARVEPQQKLQIVQSLIRLGHFVAVTGDGANDAPALRAANIGVAMGKQGTDVARETAELIITDDNFSSIVAGVEEGRVAYGNIRKVIFLLVSSGAAELVMFTLSVAAGLPPPLLPAQLLWLNLVTNGIQDVALAFEPGEGNELRRPPRSPREPIFDRLMLERMATSALVMGGISFAAFHWMLANGWQVFDARNGVLLLLVLFENVQAGNARSEHRSILSLSPLRNRFLFLGTLGAQLLHIGALYTPGLRHVLHLEPVSLRQWIVSLMLALSLFVALELHKLVRRRVHDRPLSGGTNLARS